MFKRLVVTVVLGATFIILGSGLTLSSQGQSARPTRPTTLRTLVEDAGVIAELQVESQHVAFAEVDMGHGNKFRDYFTFVTFRVQGIITGHLEGETITLRFSNGDPGGHEGIVRIVACGGSGAPIFEDGEKVILFLKQPIDDTTYDRVVDQEQGKFSVEQDPGTGKEYIANAWGGKITGVEPETGQFMTVPGPPKNSTRRYRGRGGPASRYGTAPEPPEPAHHDPLSPQEFKDLIRALLPISSSKARDLTLSETPLVGAGARPTTLRTLVEDAGVIAELHAESQHVAFAEVDMGHGNKFRDYFTFVTFRVQGIITGQLEGETITLRFPGGNPGGHEGLVRIPLGTPIFEDGEHVILFLKQPIDDSTWDPVVHEERGRFSIERDAATGKEYIVNTWGRKITGVEPETGQFMTVPGPPKSGTTRYVGRGGVAARGTEPDWREIDPGPEPAEAAHHDPLSPQEFKDLIRALLPKP